MKKLEVTLFLPEDLVAYLKGKFGKSFDEMDAYFAKFVRAEMEIDCVKPLTDTLKYRKIRLTVKEFHDAGKEISAETLAQSMGPALGVSMARDWLTRMTKDGFIELAAKRGKGGKKIYRWIGKIEESD